MRRTLSLRKVTLRHLTPAELAIAAGGLYTITVACPGNPPVTRSGSGCPETAVTLGSLCGDR